jgi:hypothetical protein
VRVQIGSAPFSRSQTILALAHTYEWETQCIKRAEKLDPASIPNELPLQLLMR